MKHIVVLTGAGMSAESGLKTFRDANGLWEGHDVMEVASPEGYANNPELVLEKRQFAQSSLDHSAFLQHGHLVTRLKITGDQDKSYEFL